MTAEVAILNRSAVALAADSAVSSLVGRNTKIYNSVNKLFALSKRRPVGVMIYGQADMMNVPWESIIKVFRDDLGSDSCKTLPEYADRFISFLENSRMLMPTSAQRDFVGTTAVAYFKGLLHQVESKVESWLKEKDRALVEADVLEIISSVLLEQEEQSGTARFLPGLNEEFELRVKTEYSNVFENGIAAIFQHLPFTEQQRALLVGFAARLFCRDRSLPGSGLVIAGFGEDETFPSLVSYQCHGMVLNTLLRKPDTTCSVESEGPTIVPFAQSDMVHTFMVGIDPRFRSVIDSYVATLFEKLPDEFVRNLPAESLPDDAREILKEKLSAAGQALKEDLRRRLTEYGHTRHISPVLAAVGMLPKGELAEMAESLVNLTSFKKKMSIDAETVGGPIDVAVISKGDGFVWIRRKHYFQPELNPMFFANYQKRSTEV